MTELTKKNDMLYHKGTLVETVDINQCLIEFCKFLSNLDKPVLLYGHNARRFDCPLLVDALSRCRLIDHFSEIVSGFGDTLIALKSVLPEERSYKQSDLVAKHLNKSYDAHDALEDVRALQALLKAVASDEIMRVHSFDVADIRHQCRNQISNRPRMASLEGMITDGVVSRYIAKKITTSGLTHDDLVGRYKTSGEEGVVQLLAADIEGKPRVTNRGNILQSIVAYLKENAKRQSACDDSCN